MFTYSILLLLLSFIHSMAMRRTLVFERHIGLLPFMGVSLYLPINKSVMVFIHYNNSIF